MTKSNKARNPRSPLKGVKKRAKAWQKRIVTTAKKIPAIINWRALRTLRNVCLGSFPPPRDAAQHSVEYTKRVSGLVEMAKQVVKLALMDKTSRHLVLSLLTDTNREAFVLTRIMNSIRVLRKMRQLIAMNPGGCIMDAVLHKMQLCITQRKEFPLQCEWAPNSKISIAYQDDLELYYARTRKMREADMAEKRLLAASQVTMELGNPDIAGLILSLIQ